MSDYSIPTNASRWSPDLMLTKFRLIPQGLRAFRKLLCLGAISSTILLAQQVPIHSPVQSSEADDHWSVQDKQDVMDERKITHMARMYIDAESNGRHGEFEVTASCEVKTSVKFDVVYSSKFDKDLGFQRLGSGVPIRLRVDKEHPVSIIVSSEHRNEAVFEFKSLSPEIDQSRKELADAQMSPQYMSEVGSTENLFAADLIVIEFTLDNGDTPILKLHPKSPSLKQFVANCR